MLSYRARSLPLFDYFRCGSLRAPFLQHRQAPRATSAPDYAC
eukprot:COSAG06_NODE_14811_length_1124_cov_0.986341_3_plen_41_part_01